MDPAASVCQGVRLLSAYTVTVLRSLWSLFISRYIGKILVNQGFYKMKLDTRFDTHCIKTGVQLWQGH